MPILGLKGISFFVTPFATCKVVNNRGVGLSGVTIQIPSGEFYVSDNKGNVNLPSITNPSTLIITKDMVRYEYVWTGATQFTVNIEPAPIPM